MQKGVAIPYVIALILGVAVIGLLGVWFVMAGGKFTKQSSETECQNKLAIYCSKLLLGTVTAGDWDINCNSVLGFTIQDNELDTDNKPALSVCPF